MTPEEVKLLQHAGRVIISNMGILVTDSVLYGLYLAIFTFGIRALLRRNPWTKYTWTLFGFLLILCLILTVDVAMEVAFDVNLIRGGLIRHSELSLIDRLRLADDLVTDFAIAQTWLGSEGGVGFLFLFADAVVVWRACVLWPGRTVRVFLLALLCASFGSVVVSSTLKTISFSDSASVPTSSPAGVVVTLNQSLSLATNVVATALIGSKAYYHRQMMKITMMAMQSSRSGAILLFLTESGVVFCIIQVISLATATAANNPSMPFDQAVIIWQSITSFTAAAYPVVVLIIVDNHRSISDSTGGSAGDSNMPQGSNIVSRLSFAAQPGGDPSRGGGVSEDSLVGSRVDPTASVEHFQEGSVRVQDLEKGERLTAEAASSI